MRLAFIVVAVMVVGLACGEEAEKEKKNNGYIFVPNVRKTGTCEARYNEKGRCRVIKSEDGCKGTDGRYSRQTANWRVDKESNTVIKCGCMCCRIRKEQERGNARLACGPKTKAVKPSEVEDQDEEVEV